MAKSVFVFGATGAVGKRLCPILVSDNWRVIGSTRQAQKSERLRELNVEPVVLDVFNVPALERALFEFVPNVVIIQLTDLPIGLPAGEMEQAALRNAKIWDVGTHNILSAMVKAKCDTVIAQSIAFAYADGPLPHTEIAPLNVNAVGHRGNTVRGAVSLEKQMLSAHFQSIVLRYGLLYGAGTGFDTAPGKPALHVDAAAKAAALAAGAVPPGIYNITEDDGEVSCDKARRLLGWDPQWRLVQQESIK